MISAIWLVATTMTSAAPAPTEKKDSETPPPTGPAPIVLFVKADKQGKVRIPVQSKANLPFVPMQLPGRAPLGQQPPILQTTIERAELVELSEIEGLTIRTGTGAKIEVAEALKQLVDGGYVLIPADGKKISSGWLQLYRSDRVLVLGSPRFIPVLGGSVTLPSTGTTTLLLKTTAE
jgi:hypothetical protein